MCAAEEKTSPSFPQTAIGVWGSSYLRGEGIRTSLCMFLYKLPQQTAIPLCDLKSFRLKLDFTLFLCNSLWPPLALPQVSACAHVKLDIFIPLLPKALREGLTGRHCYAGHAGCCSKERQPLLLCCPQFSQTNRE